MIGLKAVTSEDDLVLMTQNGILMRMSIADLSKRVADEIGHRGRHRIRLRWW